MAKRRGSTPSRPLRLADMAQLTDDDVIRPASTPTPDDALRQYRDKPYMEAFSEREKDVLILVHVCLMTQVEVAEYLGISRKTVNEYLRRIEEKRLSIV